MTSYLARSNGLADAELMVGSEPGLPFAPVEFGPQSQVAGYKSRTQGGEVISDAE